MSIIGDRLKEERLRNGWSQRDLAHKSRTNVDTISGIETGQHEPRPSTLRKLARALNIEVRDLFEEPTLVGKDKAPETGLATTAEQAAIQRLKAPPKIELEQLHQRKIPASEVEVRVLNQYLENFWLAQETGGPFAVAALAKDNIDFDRIYLLVSFVLTSDILTQEETEAVREAVHDRLIGTRG